MLARNLDDAQQQRRVVQHAGGVVRIDHHDALGARRDAGPDVVQAGHPAIGFIAQVMHRGRARQAGGCGPERVVGLGQQQLVAIVQQCVGRHGDEFAGAVTQVDVVQRDPGHALLLGLVHHRFAGCENPLAVGVTRRVGQVSNHVLLDFLGCIKAEHRQVANI